MVLKSGGMARVGSIAIPNGRVKDGLQKGERAGRLPAERLE